MKIRVPAPPSPEAHRSRWTPTDVLTRAGLWPGIREARQITTVVQFANPQFLGYNPFDPAAFHERIRLTRHVQGITQKELAHELGIDPGTLGRWGKGRSIPRATPRRVHEVLSFLLSQTA